ncbi:MAG TPA: alpha/beta hydrolase family protein [Clostridiales bacterium]|nr:alpha/beta hydrolase family protein [Clostridiales bacterium]
MALIHCNFTSETLGVASSMCAILPQPQYIPENKDISWKNGGYPVLYLLHGLSDDHTIWQRRTSIERYVASMNIAVVMPAVNRSFYSDMAYGQKYWTFVSEELPFIVRNLFPISNKREDTFVAGISMGGYGAFKLALTHPERFAAAASLSGVMDVAAKIDELGHENNECRLIFGDNSEIRRTKSDLFYLAEKVAKSDGLKPKLFQCCGTEDFLYTDNIRFRDFCKNLPLELTYEEETGTHEWGYWDKKIQRVLAWLNKE